MGKVYTRFQTKNHTLWGPHTYMAYIREYPPVSVNPKECENKTTKVVSVGCIRSIIT